MRTRSIYRGQARTGIGEGPGRPVAQGEQFLAADRPLDQDGELLAAVRPWMTLDWRPADEQALGPRLEAWSYFPYGDLRFVVRLVAAGVYDRRAAYFAHGRAFSAGEIAGAADPGAYLGLSAAFAEPWRDARPPAAPPLPPLEMVRPAQVLAEPAVAGALLAHLYQALASGYPVVMAVPVPDFEAGGPLHSLVSFARAALPLAVKSGCRIRVFTRLPELFLRSLRADLVVVPESEAANALAARRDATLLDRSGLRREGRDYSPEAGRYAEAVLQRVSRLPAGLLGFAGAIGEHFPGDRLPGEQELARVPVIYNLLAARADPAALGEWIHSNLLRQVAERPTGLAWDRLLRPEDWHALSFDDLARILLAAAAGEEAHAILRLAEGEARRPERHERIAEERLRRYWDELAPERRPALLARLLGSPEAGRSLVAPETAARLSAALGAPALLASGAAAHLLAAELEAGLLRARGGDPAGLATLATRDAATAGVLAAATAQGTLPPDWLLAVLAETDDAVLAVAGEILPAALASLHWRPVLARLFDRLLAIPGLPRCLAPAFEEALLKTKVPDPLGECEDLFVLAELAVRCGSPQAGSAIDRLWRLAEALAGTEERRRFLRRVADPGWRSLEPGRLLRGDGQALAVPWLEGLAEDLLGSPEVRDRLPTTLLVRLAGERSELAGWLDPRMRSEPRETSDALLRTRRWSRWRSGSAAGPEVRREASLAWLSSTTWQEPSAPEAHLEDWKQVVEDLGDLRGEDIAGLVSGDPPRPRWPWITPFQDEQLGDLCRLARHDLGALAELAEGLDPGRDLGYPIPGTIVAHVLAQADPALGEGLPAEALGVLCGRPGRVALPLREAQRLLARTLHRRDRAAAELRRSIAQSLAGQPLAALQAAETLSRDDPEIVEVVRAWRAPSHLAAEARAILGRLLPAPGRAGAGAAPDPIVQALLQGAAGHGCWKKLDDEMRSYVSAQGSGGHPVSRLATKLRATLDGLPDRGRATLTDRGWETFSAAARAHCSLLHQPFAPGQPLPALEVAALLNPGSGIGRVALALAHLDTGRAHLRLPEWWDSLLSGLTSARWGPELRDAGDREEAALAVIYRQIPDLLAEERQRLAVQDLIGERIARIYLGRGVDLVRNFAPRATDRAGAAR